MQKCELSKQALFRTACPLVKTTTENRSQGGEIKSGYKTRLRCTEAKKGTKQKRSKWRKGLRKITLALQADQKDYEQKITLSLKRKQKVKNTNYSSGRGKDKAVSQELEVHGQ